MTRTGAVSAIFHEGDEVVLVKGTYQDTLGAFVRFRNDVGWADIAERNGEVRSHPIAWLGHTLAQDRISLSAAAAERLAGIE